MRKKIIPLAILLLVALLAGCAKKQEGTDFSKVDSVTILYGVSSYAMHSEDKETIDAVLACFKPIVLVPTDKKIDEATTLSVTFSAKGEAVASFRVDESGVFQMGKDERYFTDSTKSFDYAALKKFYK